MTGHTCIVEGLLRIVRGHDSIKVGRFKVQYGLRTTEEVLFFAKTPTTKRGMWVIQGTKPEQPPDT